MEKCIQGGAVRLGDNIDTDQIYPGRYLDEIEPAEIGRHCLENQGEMVCQGLMGGIVVAGVNFGCGSSREHAVISLMNAGIKAVVACSFARIFFRNAINLGLPAIICTSLPPDITAGEMVEIDLENGLVHFPRLKQTLQGEKPGQHILSIIHAGGIKPLMLGQRRAAKSSTK